MIAGDNALFGDGKNDLIDQQVMFRKFPGLATIDFPCIPHPTKIADVVSGWFLQVPQPHLAIAP